MSALIQTRMRWDGPVNPSEMCKGWTWYSCRFRDGPFIQENGPSPIPALRRRVTRNDWDGVKGLTFARAEKGRA